MSQAQYVLKLGALQNLVASSVGSPLWPNATNTGVQDDISLTTYSGSDTLPAGIYENMLFPAVGTFYTFLPGNNLVVRNCRFMSGATFIKCDNMVVEHSEAPGIAFSSCHGATARFLNLFGTTDDFIDVTGDAIDRPDNRCLDITIENCYLHDPTPSVSAHVDGIQTRGVKGLTVRNCYIDLGTWQAQHNAALFLENANGGTTDTIINNCYLNGGGYIARFGITAGQFEVTDNQFGPDGQFGEYTLSAPAPTRQSGNKNNANQPLIFIIND